MTRCGQSRHILVVDDEAAVRTLLRECFESEGYRVTEAADGRSLDAVLGAGTVHLVTLDLNLGGDDGLEVARRIRASQDVPIIMISGKGDIIDRVVGLELGADDYITKPFHMREVLARVRAVMRRYEAPDATTVSGATPCTNRSSGGETYRFDRWTLQCGQRSLVSDAGEAPELTTAEFNLLVMFLERPTRVLSRDTIMDLLKGHDWQPNDRSIDATILRLRRKIEVVPEKPQLIKSVRGVGYLFSGIVRRA